ncbi:TetR family transcriptional regulator [Rhodococcus sp. NPDC059968]|uniref:TetR family transcriptional regulator n=1 Tax=Rhodococcus sp. NPDC059968 TaxID=3347017 RepID=UPI00367119E8
MDEVPNFQAEVRQLLRDRLLDAATEIVCGEGWAAVTMSGVADRVGVSRQMLYKDIGAKQALGQALVGRETNRFITGIVERLRAHESDAVAGMTAAADFTLRTGAENALLKAIVAGAHGSDAGLLPLLTAQTEPVLQRVIDAITAEAKTLDGTLHMGERQLTHAIEVVVRLTLSHLLQPVGPAERAVDQIRLVITPLLHPIARPY